MKSSAFAFILLVLSMAACTKKDVPADTSSVTITLNGSTEMAVDKGASMGDPGASASNADGVDFTEYLTSDWNQTFGSAAIDTFEVTYRVTYKDQILAVKKRKVVIRFTAALPLGIYSGVYSYTLTRDMMPVSQGTSAASCTITAGPQPDQFVAHLNAGDSPTFTYEDNLGSKITAKDGRAYLLPDKGIRMTFSSTSRQNSINLTDYSTYEFQRVSD